MSKNWTLIKKSNYQEKYSETDYFSPEVIDHALEKGSKVKLIFNAVDNESNEQMTELLWVEILLVQDEKYLGQLEDDPKIIHNLMRGEMIDFDNSHIFESEYVDPYDSRIKL